MANVATGRAEVISAYSFDRRILLNLNITSANVSTFIEGKGDRFSTGAVYAINPCARGPARTQPSTN